MSWNATGVGSLYKIIKGRGLGDKSSPMAIPGHSFVSVGVGSGVKADGSVWTWGYNALGDQTTVPRSSPVSVVSSGYSLVPFSGYDTKIF